MYVRIFFSAVDPVDADAVRRIFAEDVKPAFAESGCLSVELLVNTEPSAGGLVEGLVVSHWKTEDEIAEALTSRGIVESLVRVRQYLRLEPITRTFEALA